MSKPLRLFVVEPHEEIAFLICRHLERAGHAATDCQTGADALIVLTHKVYDLVLLVDKLPDMRGLDVLNALARSGVRIPALMMMTRGNEKDVAEALLAGANDFVVKDDALAFLADLPKRAEEAATRNRLQQSNQLLIAALESAHDGICVTDLQGTLLHVNKALETMTGYNRQELIGQNPRLFKSDRQGAEFYAGLWRTILAGNSWQGEMVNRRKNGTHVETSLTISPILDQRSQVIQFVGIFRDVTERKLLERQLLHAQKMQSVGTLAGGVAHEFNNLLAGIQGYAALGLREPGVAAEVREFLELIVDLSDRAANLTRQLLAFARKPALTRKPTDMGRLLTSTAELVRQSLKIEVNIEIQSAAEMGEPLQALADGNQLQQVLVNLALNARDALTRPEPVLFRAERRLLGDSLAAFPQNVPPGDYVVLEVRDHGHGMPAEVLEHACDPFFTTKEVGKGTGLGLPVAFGIAQGHQGHLTLESKVGEGSAVRLFLPRLVAEVVTSPQSGRGTEVVEPAKRASCPILVVDDEHAVLDIVRRALEIAGHRATCVTNGAEALELLTRGNSFDLVILDLMIPHEDGWATLKNLQRRWPKLPILLCTGLLQTDLSSPAFKSGRVHLLRKPFRMNELWQAVNSALN